MRAATDFLLGSVRVEAVGAFPAGLLNACARAGISFWDPEPIDACTLRLSVHRGSLRRLRLLSSGAQCTLKVLRSRGMPKYAGRVRRRWALLAGLPICLVLWFISSLFIWEIDVTGNETVPDYVILRALEDAGVSIGSFWPSFTSDMIRCRVLLETPELKWITVNVSGSRAQVIVRERIEVPEMLNEQLSADVVAGKAGIVTNMRVLSGTAAVKPGQTVLPGEVLVSGGVPDVAASPRSWHAVAEVEARTWYDSTAVMPLTTQEKTPTGEHFQRWAVVFGQKRINFYRNSSIFSSGYDKITKETQLGIQGLFALPITIVRERYERYETQQVPVDSQAARQMLEARLQQLLDQELADAGRSVSVRFSASEHDGLLSVTLRAECLENIAVTVETAPQRGISE